MVFVRLVEGRFMVHVRGDGKQAEASQENIQNGGKTKVSSEMAGSIDLRNGGNLTLPLTAY